MTHKEDWDALPLGNMQQSRGAFSDLQPMGLSQSSSLALRKLQHYAEHLSPLEEDMN